MKNIRIQVGQRDGKFLILKYTEATNGAENYHHYPIDENPHKTAYYLKLQFPQDNLTFESLPVEEKERITPVDKNTLDKLIEAFSCLK